MVKGISGPSAPTGGDSGVFHPGSFRFRIFSRNFVYSQPHACVQSLLEKIILLS